MNHSIFLPENVKLDKPTTAKFVDFLQKMANRRAVGALRYGDKPDPDQQYLRRLKRELRAYEASGNIEQLINIAVYCFLESAAPQNPKAHFDPTAPSATRGR